jgi:GT2 family glycosyltransferase
MMTSKHGFSTCEDPVEVALIAVNYNSAAATESLIEDALAQASGASRLTVIIADNSPSASGMDALLERYRLCPSVRFVTMPRNLGYFGAAHYVVESVLGHDVPEWVIVSNTDIRLPQPDLFDRLATMLPPPAVIAPRIISGRTGLDQNPFHRTRPSAARMYLNRIIPRMRLLFWLLDVQCAIKRRIQRRFSTEPTGTLPEPVQVYAPHGAFIIFNRKYFAAGGSLNVGAFLFAEEKFVAETCRHLGLEVRYDPTLHLIHDEHVSTGRNPAIPGFQAEAADYLYREFYRNGRNIGATAMHPPK